MLKLTDKQLVILNAAVARNDRRALPVPGSLKLSKGPAASLLAGLVRRGLLEAHPAGKDDIVWREDGDGRLTLIVSDMGLTALGVDPGDSTKSQKRKSRKPAKKEPAVMSSMAPEAKLPRIGTKLAALVDLLRRDDGVTIAEIMTATGWQAHSVRGAISGAVKKKLGLEVASEVDNTRGRVYCISDVSECGA